MPKNSRKVARVQIARSTAQQNLVDCASSDHQQTGVSVQESVDSISYTTRQVDRSLNWLFNPSDLRLVDLQSHLTVILLRVS
ncbi:uncharacterized protein L969DRAFT_30200, partial [Mixia osmundae IAM 14324]|uniref:uncharacterized protein n=1 Tax=Mixia osmundae (strain CBS 9802 / IAM 14324 / JCM 22182 / KY 12970) TaxID=764103 RepID=UPI0004A55614